MTRGSFQQRVDHGAIEQVRGRVLRHLSGCQRRLLRRPIRAPPPAALLHGAIEKTHRLSLQTCISCRLRIRQSPHPCSLGKRIDQQTLQLCSAVGSSGFGFWGNSAGYNQVLPRQTKQMSSLRICPAVYRSTSLRMRRPVSSAESVGAKHIFSSLSMP